MLAAAYQAIKAVNPDTIVISAAPAPTGFFGDGCGYGGCDDNVFMYQMAQAGAANYADCIGVHYNEGILPPTSQGGDPRSEHPTRYLIPMLRRVAWPFRNADIPMCMTEIGYLSPEGYGPLPQGFAWASTTSVTEQAAWLSQALLIMSNFEDMPVELAIVWNIDFDIYGADPQAGYAIIRHDGTCPACEPSRSCSAKALACLVGSVGGGAPTLRPSLPTIAAGSQALLAQMLEVRQRLSQGEAPFMRRQALHVEEPRRHFQHRPRAIRQRRLRRVQTRVMMRNQLFNPPAPIAYQPLVTGQRQPHIQSASAFSDSRKRPRGLGSLCGQTPIFGVMRINTWSPHSIKRSAAS